MMHGQRNIKIANHSFWIIVTLISLFTIFPNLIICDLWCLVPTCRSWQSASHPEVYVLFILFTSLWAVHCLTSQLLHAGTSEGFTFLATHDFTCRCAIKRITMAFAGPLFGHITLKGNITHSLLYIHFSLYII
jgi:hypothetical protein